MYYGKKFESREELEKAITEYIDYYTNDLPQRGLGVLTPMEFHEKQRFGGIKMLPDIHRATQKFYIFLIVYLTDAHQISHICDFSRGMLNVRLDARIQHLLLGHKYGLFYSQVASPSLCKTEFTSSKLHVILKKIEEILFRNRGACMIDPKGSV